jgi:hypothetical protein
MLVTTRLLSVNIILPQYNQAPFGTKEKWKNSRGFRSYIGNFPINPFGTKAYGIACFIEILEEFYQEVESHGKFPLCHSHQNPVFHMFSQSIGFKMLGHSIPMFFQFWCF